MPTATSTRTWSASTGGRFISLLGDAELDEGNIWEALAEPLARRLGNVLWIVDLNRQSLDRVIPGIRAAELEAQFRDERLGGDRAQVRPPAAGGVRRGRRRAAPATGSTGCRTRSTRRSSARTTRSFGRPCSNRSTGGDRARLAQLLDRHDGGVAPLVRDLGGHDLGDVLDALLRARETPDRPTVMFAYTIKGYDLEIAGRPQNHSALLTGEQIDRLRLETGLTLETEWDGYAADTPEGRVLAAARERLDRGERPAATTFAVPRRLSDRDPARSRRRPRSGGSCSTSRASRESAERLVTVSPDVSVSTSLGGFINKTGVWGPDEEPVYDAMDDSPLKWRVGPTGQHVEMGIAEMNLVLALGQLGLTWDFQRERLFPIGTLYDPFVMRALEGIVYSHLLGLAVRPRRHPVRDLALTRGWRPPVALNTRGSGSRPRG